LKTAKSIVWGFVLLFVGVILCLNSLELLSFDIFFNGWWTLFIIVPSFIGLFSENNKLGSIIFLIIGILLLLSCQNILDFSLVKKLIAPIIIILIGLSLIFKNVFNNSINKSIKSINSNNQTKESCVAVFSGKDIKLDKEEFNGTTLNAIFGGIKIDLRNAIIKEDVVINCSAIFGGIDIYLPDNVKVKIKSNSVFGGVDNNNNNTDKDITVFIDATCIFGGIDIK